MFTLIRFEDVLSDWHRRIDPELETIIEDSEKAAGADTDWIGFISNLNTNTVHRISESSLKWLDQQGHWHNPLAKKDQVLAEVRAAAVQFATLPSSEIEDTVGIPNRAWALTGAIGAALGALIISPLTWLWFENRAIGMFLGGVLGTLAVNWGLAIIAERPQVQAFLRNAAATAGAGMVGTGLWRAARGQPLSWFLPIMILSGILLLLSLVRPRPLPGKSDVMRRHLYAASRLRYCADLILAISWVHPDRLPSAEPPAARPSWPEKQICAALSDLRADFAKPRPLDDIHGALQVLFQRFEDAGYEWRHVTGGTPYEEGMRDAFSTFGAISPGQPVRSLRPAMLRHGEVIHQGELVRI